VLSGYPHLEEAYRVGELLFPHLDLATDDDVNAPARRAIQAHGELVAHDFAPQRVSES